MTDSLTSPTGKPIVLPAVQPNRGLIAAYRRWLVGLIYMLGKEDIDELKEAWGAQDEKPTDRMTWLQLALLRIRHRWIRLFDNSINTHVSTMLGRVQQSVDIPLRASLRSKGLSIPFRPTAAQTEALRATVEQNVSAIKSIPEAALRRVEQTVWNGVMKGMDAGQIVRELHDDQGVTRRQAERIANHQIRVATGQLNVTRCVEVGITHGIWMHSGASREPRPSHVHANGKVFDLREGMYLDGKWVWPGSEYGCNCTFKPVIMPPK